MKKESLRERILKYIRKRPDVWFNGGEMERLAFENGYKASNASRRLRELCEDGFIEREEKMIFPSHIATVWYRYKPSEQEIISNRMKQLTQ